MILSSPVVEGAVTTLCATARACVPQVSDLAEARRDARLVRERVVREGRARRAAVVAGGGLVGAGVAGVADAVERPVLRAGGADEAAGVAGQALVAGLAGAVGAEGGGGGGRRERGARRARGGSRRVLEGASDARRARPPVRPREAGVALAGRWPWAGCRGRALGGAVDAGVGGGVVVLAGWALHADRPVLPRVPGVADAGGR